MRCITCDSDKYMEVNLGFIQYIFATGALIGALGYLIHSVKQPSGTQRIQLEELKKEQQKEKAKAMSKQAIVIGGIALLALASIKEGKKIIEKK